MEQRDVIIIGAGPAGLSAAIFTQLDGWNTLILEARWVGGQGGGTACVAIHVLAHIHIHASNHSAHAALVDSVFNLIKGE